jgi:hypothetical protein
VEVLALTHHGPRQADEPVRYATPGVRSFAVTTSTTVPSTNGAAGPEKTADELPATEGTPSPKGPRWSGRRIDLLVTVAYLLGAFWVTMRGWQEPWGRILGDQAKDQAFNEWMLAYDAHVVRHLTNPFFTTLQNAPDGVNLMGNIALQGPGLLLAPVTMAAGPEFSYLLLITANLFLTALAWYWVLSRRLVHSRTGAFVGALVIGFAPAMISHSNGHPHMTAQWLLPFIIWRVVRLGEPGITVRNGLILGGLVLAQVFVGEENLFLTAVACALWVVAYAIFNFSEARARLGRALGSLAIAGGLVLIFVAYPLYLQFAGPQHYSGHPGDPKPAMLASFVGHATESIGGGKRGAAGLAPNFTEDATFYGWPGSSGCAGRRSSGSSASSSSALPRSRSVRRSGSTAGRTPGFLGRSGCFRTCRWSTRW